MLCSSAHYVRGTTYNQRTGYRQKSDPQSGHYSTNAPNTPTNQCPAIVSTLMAVSSVLRVRSGLTGKQTKLNRDERQERQVARQGMVKEAGKQQEKLMNLTTPLSLPDTEASTACSHNATSELAPSENFSQWYSAQTAVEHPQETLEQPSSRKPS